jgi:GT2 family glycosyltransferase
MSLMLEMPAASASDAGSSERTVLAVSPALDSEIEIVVCIPCFRRPQHLRFTLESLVAQQTTRRFAVVLVENDDRDRESAAVAEDFLLGERLAGICVAEPRQGNCQAINAAFETALAMFPLARHFLMIDDDEVASTGWLDLMARTAEATHADVVGGPVWPTFEDRRMQGLRNHPAFRPAYDVTGTVPVIYGCGNCLITRAVFERLGRPTFDLRFNFLGGGDTDFFYRCRDAGMSFHWAADALISETVPTVRTKPAWLALRGLRIGAINYHVQRKLASSLAGRIRLIAKMLTLLPLSLVRAGRLVLARKAGLIALHPVLVATGSALAAVGIEPQPYKAAKIT